MEVFHCLYYYYYPYRVIVSLRARAMEVTTYSPLMLYVVTDRKAIDRSFLLFYNGFGGDFMRKHKIKNRGKDRKIFKRTADSVKSINVTPISMRGGIRL